jgi:hypothetical protein
MPAFLADTICPAESKYPRTVRVALMMVLATAGWTMLLAPFM